MRNGSAFGMLVLGLVSFALSADIYVSPTGNDGTGDGSMGAPYATLTKARDAADLVKAGGTVNVYLRAGTYYLAAPVTFAAANSGTSATAPIIYQCYPGEKAIISGGFKVTSAWTSTTLNGVTVQTTNIGTNKKVDQLFLNGTRQILARYPDYNAGQILQGYAASGTVFGQVNAAATPQEAPGYIRTLHGSMWGGNDFYITGKGSGTGQPPWQWVGDNNRGNGYNGTYMMAENISEFLNAAGEWYYKKSTGDLYFYPPAGTNMSTATIELASVTQLLQFNGSSASSANSVKYIQFKNVVFTHSYRSLFDGTGEFYEKVTASDWAIYRRGTVFMQNAENIRIESCLFDQIGGNGVFMSGYNRNNVVYNCDFELAGANCVCMFGLRSSIRCPNAWPNVGSCGDVTPGPLTNEYPAYCRIDNNMMNSCGRFEKQTSGVTCSAAEFDTIRHNTIHTIPRAGINFCDGCWGGHLVDYNWVYDCVKETSDHGPFNAWGRDRILIYGSGNLAASRYDACNTTYVRMNRFEAPVGMFGIDLDDQATNYYQEKNLLLGGGGLKLQWNRYNTYINNILVRSATVQFHGPWNGNTHYGARNIIIGPCDYGSLNGNDQGNIRNSVQQWDSNVVYNNGNAPTITSWSQNSACGGTTQCTWANWQAAGLDPHSQTGTNPGFVDTQKTWTRTPPYLPRGDFNPTNAVALTTLKFQTFAMDSFGVMGTPGVAVKEPFKTTGFEVSDVGKAVSVRYSARRLTVSYSGDYQVAITSASGRTLATFNGKGRSEFVLEPKHFGFGIYFANVHTKNGLVTRRFIMIK
jgi:hypothetical protein